MAGDETQVKLGLRSEAKFVGLRPTSRVVYFRAGANYIRGQLSCVVSRETAIIDPTLKPLRRTRQTQNFSYKEQLSISHDLTAYDQIP